MKSFLRGFWASFKKVSLSRWMIAALVLFIPFVLWLNSSQDNVDRTQTETQTQTEELKPTKVASPLTGVMVSEQLAKRPVTAVIIENSPEARPQSGLMQAGVVFESIAEGGITRFLNFYQESRPNPLGPIRSLRPYFNDWILAFDASVAHVGGSAEAIQQADSLGIKSLNQFYNGNYYYRTSDRYAPHNVYSDFNKLDAINKIKGYTSSKFDAWPRKEDSALAAPKAKTINVDVSSYLYNSEFRYSAASNSYKRFMAGQPHNDRESGKQISPKVVIVINTNYSIDPDGRYQYDLVGSGSAHIFQDGNVIKATWKKPKRSSMMHFYNSNNQKIELNAGQVWISALSNTQNVRYQ